MFVRLNLFQARSKVNSDAILKEMGKLLYHLATRFKGSTDRQFMLLDYICSKRIASEPQLSGGC